LRLINSLRDYDLINCNSDYGMNVGFNLN